MGSGKLTQKMRILAVHAHPDDEASKGAATVAKYLKLGHEVLIVTCTGGERGDLLNKNLDESEFKKDIKEFRKKEMQDSINVLGAKHEWLAFEDSGWVEKGPVPKGSFADVPIQEPGDKLIKIVREFKPHVLITYDENGGYPHPDHIRTHEISMHAWENSQRLIYKSELGSPWKIKKLYYHQTFSTKKLAVFAEAFKRLGIEDPYAQWFDEKVDDSHLITTQIECAEFFDVRDAALKAHASQVDPEGEWFAMPRDEEKKIWPFEDYQLAATRVDTTLPETDLLTGLR